jgi:protein-export membrane protein SecD
MDTSSESHVAQEEVRDNPVVRWARAAAALVIGGMIAFFVFQNATSSDAQYPFKLGLDLAGGSQLIYNADVSDVDPQEVPELMQVLREVIERRINVFGVSEPIVQVEQSSFVTEETQHRLLIELPGVTDVEEATAEIGRTPLLEFKLVDQEAMASQQLEADLGTNATGSVEVALATSTGTGTAASTTATSSPYMDTELTGRYLESAQIDFRGQQSGGVSNEPIVLLNFNNEGSELFETITRQNTGEQLAIFLDGEVISSPRINEAIPGGTAVISGGFDPNEARELAQNLNFGALPIPIELASTQTIGATLGQEVLSDGIFAAMVGIALIVAFMVLWYRVPGVVAILALGMYAASMLALFMVIPVTLTAAGLAGFILSLGMAVDANVLVFERMQELYRQRHNSQHAAYEGFRRAWSAIRDGNITSLLSAVILFWFGTSLVKGFALVFGIGVLVSMVTAVLVTRTLLLALPAIATKDDRFGWLYRSLR